MSTFGEMLRSKRKEKGVKLVDLAIEAGISHSYLSNIENDKRNPPSKEVALNLLKSVSSDDNKFIDEAMYKAGYMSDSEYMYKFHKLDKDVVDLAFILTQDKQDVICSLEIGDIDTIFTLTDKQKKFLLDTITNMLVLDGSIDKAVDEAEQRDYEEQLRKQGIEPDHKE